MRLHGNPTAWYLFLATERTHAHRTSALTPTLFSSAEHNIQSTLLVISRWVWAYTPAPSQSTRHSPQPTGTRSHLGTQDHGSRGHTIADSGRTYNHTKILHARCVFWCPYTYRQVFLPLRLRTHSSCILEVIVRGYLIQYSGQQNYKDVWIRQLIRL